MCGRIVQYRSPEDYAAALRLSEPDPGLSLRPATFNGAPGQDFLIVRQEGEGNEPVLCISQWGFAPDIAGDRKMSARLATAHAETVVTEGSFCAAYRYRRCLVPVDSFYEWKKLGPMGKQPHAVGMEDGRPFTLAGLWENWRGPEGAWLRTFAIVTITSNKLLAGINDRMPLIIDPQDRARWLSDEGHPGDLLRQHPSEGMARWLVSPEVNSLRNNGPSLLAPMAAAG
ncbi:SOS response-associated peptidase [Microvirga subterranea]|uniref:Abasic site processing protein n=1 Tax=Microvirga subterranea TaxID=186651 RepID=A0A370HQY4_9HYPH|nr:SOS response-associated peptidase [Microvirga subterranea]RDI60956.1 putative SOS response-associated peptidase YedK [Microvirga subterranea]